MSEDPIEKMESSIAILKAQLSSSTMNRAPDCKEPHDICDLMMPVAYAMFGFLADSGIATGRDEDWWSFLDEALLESVNASRTKAIS